MPISVACPVCAARIKAPDLAAGRRVKCPKCGEPLAVPSATGPTPDWVPDSPPEAASAENVQQPETKKCPFCGGEVMAIARKCRHCDETIDVKLRAAEEAKRKQRRTDGKPRRRLTLAQR